MKIAIVGAGRVGGTLARSWSRAGHTIIVGSRNPNDEKIAALVAECGPDAKSAAIEECAREADVIFMATPWNATESVVRALGDLSGKVLLDATNPIVPGAEERTAGLLLGHTTSAAEQIAAWAPAARVVKAFNTTGAANMANPAYGERRAVVFICGDDAAARETAVTLARDAGLNPVDSGRLSIARLLEPIAMLWIHLAYGAGLGPDFTFDVVTRPDQKR